LASYGRSYVYEEGSGATHKKWQAMQFALVQSATNSIEEWHPQCVHRASLAMGDV
jgi:hypothetical protein